jgi:amino acid adenylation domain-containing protein
VARYEFAASSEQRRMWVLDRLDPGQATYNVPWALWLDGPLDVPALGQAWAFVVGRHEALRTVFRADGGVPVQVVDDDPGEAAVLTVVPGEGGLDGEIARARLRDLARVPFDLAVGPLVRASLLKLAPGRHVLSLVAHHIVADGWSFRVLFRELAGAYLVLAAGKQPALAGPDLQYADFALWQAEHDQAGGYAGAEAFWRSELLGAPAELALPVDRPYPDTERTAAATIAVTIGTVTAAALRRLAADRGITLFAVIAAGYAALLSRLSGAEDLLIAVPVAARTRAETEPVVGLFANTMVIRADLRGDPSLGVLADRVHAANARAQAHQELPFARVVELAGPARRGSRSPLVQVLCAIEEAWPVQSAGALTGRPELTDNGTGKFELEFTVTEQPDGFDARLRYRSDLFDPATASRLADGISLVLAAMGDEPATTISAVEILPPEARDLVTRVWPGAACPPAGDAPPSPAALAARALARSADRVVISGTDREFTGAQLRERAVAIAAGLSGLGAGLQDTVAIMLPRGAGLLAALLGAWWAGTAYVPVDPAQPSARIRGMLADAGVRVLISDRAALGSLLAGLDGDLPVLDLGQPLPAAGGTTGLPPDLPPEAAAYVLFTSGSTGRPKAVTVTHGSLGYLFKAVGDLYALGPGDRLAAVTSFGFDISVVELLLPLIAGARVTVVDADVARDGAALRRVLAAEGSTVLQGTPATWRLLAAAGGVPAQVRLRVSGGEALPRDLADVLRDGAEPWNLYGPTETTVWSTAGRIAAGPQPPDVGIAIAGTQVYVLDRWANPVGPGVTGEVYLGGAGVARGYAGAPGLTAGRFLPDPFSGRPGARLYRTGDLGRWLPSGRLELLGRADRQLKIRGFRVEAAEIEIALRSCPDVIDAVVTATGTSLVGYVVTTMPEPDQVLRAHLRSILPDYMIPSVFVTLPELPRNASGKIDYRALPEPEVQPAGPPVAPRTPLEAELAGILASVLRRPGPVGALDNFFVVGGHSLTATQVMAEIWTRYGVDLPVRTLFDDPTVAGLAAAVSAAQAGPAAGMMAIPVPDFAGFLDALSDADIDDLLRDR